MREIKFRAFHPSTGEMYSPEKMNDSDLVLSAIGGVWYGDEELRVNEPNWELMQFTGLKDKNGVEIYEGDIIKTGYGTTLAVKWFDDLFYDGSGGGHSGFYFEDELNWNLHVDDGVVVGNIYENPELKL